MTDWSYTVLTVGSASFIRGVGVPVCETLEAQFPGRHVDPSEQDVRPPLPSGPHVTALPTALEAIVGVLIFLGAWGAKRFLDNVYELRIRPHVRRLLGAEDDAAVPGGDALRAFMFAIWHTPLERAVVVVAIGTSPAELTRSEQLIAQVHREACELLEREIPSEPVVLYVISKGERSGPSFFESIGQTLHFLQNTRAWIARRDDAR